MRAQMLDQLLLQRAAGLHVQPAIDRLVRHPQRLILGVGPLQPPGDLLRRPVVPELCRPRAPQVRVRGELTRLGAQRSTPGLPIRGLGPVGTRAAVASDLATDRRGRATQPAGDLAQRLAVHQAARDLLALRHRQRQPGASSRRRLDAAARPQVRKIEEDGLPKARPIDFRPSPFSPSLPNLRALSRRVESSLRSSSHDTPPPSSKVKCCDDRLRSPPKAERDPRPSQP